MNYNTVIALQNPTPGMSHMSGQPIVVQTPQNMYPAPRPGNVPVGKFIYNKYNMAFSNNKNETYYISLKFIRAKNS